VLFPRRRSCPLHLDSAPFAPQSQTILEQLAVGTRWRDELHRDAQRLRFEVSVLVVEEQLRVSVVWRLT